MEKKESPEDAVEYPIGDELDLHTFQAKDVRSVVEEYLYQCKKRGIREVRIVHGKGIGTQRKIVHSLLAKSPKVLSFAEAPPELGGWGATLVRIRVDQTIEEVFMEMKIGKSKLFLVRGDITKADTEAIVNAANSSLMGGGGVDGAIHRAGGSAVLAACKEIVAKQGRCPTGEAVITTGGNLPAKYVIHTVGPVWHGGDRKERELLSNAYRNSLAVAKEEGLSSVAFPSISTGAYRFPIAEAARIALTTVRDFLEENEMEEVRFVLFSEKDLAVYQEMLQEVMGGS